MKVEIKIPKMGESIVEATIGTVLKPSGSFVKEGEEVLEIETEKVNQILTAPASGEIEWKVKSGDTVKIDQTVGVVDTGKIDQTVRAVDTGKTDQTVGVVDTGKTDQTVRAVDTDSKVSTPEPKKEAPPAPVPQRAGEVRKKMDDFVAEVTRPPPPKMPSSASRPAALPRTSSRETRKKMSKLRKVIAARLVQVKNETAMLTTFNEVDMHAVIKVRTENQEVFQKKHGIKLGFMSFFVKAVTAALQKFPDINARIDKDEIVYHHFYDIGIAVGTEKGLFVPVIRDADLLSFAEIEKALKTYAEKAKNGTITVDEMQGGTFTITNGGTYGSMLSTPILNPPQSGILGMHNIVKRAVVINDEMMIRPIMYLALSYDHRIVDGKEAISFLMHIKNVLEDPARFLLDL